MLTTMLMLSLLLSKKHWMWQDRMIFRQHVVNEVSIYAICCLTIPAFTMEMDEDFEHEKSGRALLGLLCLNLLYNVVTIVVFSYRDFTLSIRKCQYRLRLNKVKPQAITDMKEKSLTEAGLLRALRDINDTKADNDGSQLSPSLHLSLTAAKLNMKHNSTVDRDDDDELDENSVKKDQARQTIC